jgi:hypothetical protein
MKSAVVYRRDDGWYVHSSSKTMVGIWMAGEPYIRLSTEDSHAALANAIQCALQASRENIPHPARFDSNFKDMLRLAGVKSWAEFMRGARSVDVDDDGLSFTFEPTHNQGPRIGYYAPLIEKTLSIPRNSAPEEIADAVQRAIALCE